MAHRFPGRPPGFDLSDSSTMAPSFGSLAEGDEVYHFAEALLDETLTMPMPMPMPMTRFPGRPPGSRQHPSFRQQQQQHQQQDDAASHLDPSQVYKFCILKFLALQGATPDSHTRNRSGVGTIGFGNDLHAHNPTSSDPTGLPPYMYSKNDIRHYFAPVHLMTMPMPDNVNSSDNDEIGIEREVFDSLESLDDGPVADGAENYSAIGFGNSFAILNTKPEEEIIFAPSDSADSALVALLYHALTTSNPVSDLRPHLIWGQLVLRIWSSFWRFHQPVYCVCIRCRKSSLRWVTALIYKLLLIAWDLWQYKTRH